MSKTNEERDVDMIPEGSQDGHPTIRFDSRSARNYHLNAARERMYHETPQGFAWSTDGTQLLPVGATAQQPAAEVVQEPEAAK